MKNVKIQDRLDEESRFTINFKVFNLVWILKMRHDFPDAFPPRENRNRLINV